MDNDALINGYFEGSLSAAQKESFDRLLRKNPEFSANFKFQLELQDSLKRRTTADKNILSKVYVTSEKPKARVIRLRPWLAAASVVFLIGISAWLLFFTNSGFDSDQLYDANFAPYENVVHPIERGEQLEDLKTRAFAAYEDENYGHALELFKELQQKQSDSYIDFYKSIVLMQLNKHEEAIPLLEDYIANDGELKDRGMWYLALAQLKMGDTAGSKSTLEKLAAQEAFKANEAEQLLEALD